MRRPFAVIGFSFVFVSFFVTSLGFGFGLALLITGAAASAAALLVRPLRQTVFIPTLALCVLAAAANGLLHWQLDYQPAAKLDGRQARVTAEIVDLPAHHRTGATYTLRTLSVDLPQAKQQVKFTVWVPELLDAQPYDQLTATVTFSLDEESRHYRYGQSVYLKGSLDTDEVQIMKVPDKPLFAAILQFRAYACEVSYRYMDADSAGLANGIVFSDESGISDQIYTDFKNCGLLHVTAVSGMNVVMLVTALQSMLAVLRVGRKTRIFISMGVSLLYMAAVGFTYSVLRSGIMLLIMLVGQLAGRQHDSLNSLGVSGLVLMLLNPFAAISVSFLLSFLATMGMIVLFVPCQNWLYQKLRLPGRLRQATVALLAPLLQTFAATIFILPVTFVFFKTVSIVSPLANLVVLPAISPVLSLGILTILFSFIPLAPQLCGWLLDGLCHYVTTVTRWIGGLPVTAISTDELYIGLWIGTALLLFAAAALLIGLGVFRNKAYAMRIASWLSVIVLLLTVGTGFAFTKDTTTVVFLDSGNGACAVIQRRDHAIVVGTGGGNADDLLADYMYERQIRTMDLLVFPTYQNTYFQNAAAVVQYHQPELVLADPGFSGYYTLEPVCTRLQPFSGSITTVWENVKLTAYPGALAVWLGQTLILFCDAKTALAALPQQLWHADLMVTGGLPPQQSNQMRAGAAIFCVNEKHAAQALDSAGAFAGAAYVTGGAGSLRVQTRGNGDLQFKRL